MIEKETERLGLDQLRARLRELSAELAYSRLSLQQTERVADIGTWETDLLTGEAHWSDGLFRLLGLRPRLFIPRDSLLLQFVHPADRVRFEAQLTRGLSGETACDTNVRIIRRDGTERVLRVRGEAIMESGTPIRFFGTAQDITERERDAETLRRREQEFRALVERAPDIILRFDRGLRYIYVNPAVERLWGRPAAELLGKTVDDAVLPAESAQYWERNLRSVFVLGRERNLEFSVYSAAGERHFEARLVPEIGDGVTKTVLAVARDVTERWAAEQAVRSALEQLAEEKARVDIVNAELARANALLEQLAVQDPLTGIGNRRYLERFIEREWRRARRHHRQVSLAMVDIDFFKAYNDHYGHPRGDDCLRQVAATMAANLRRPTDLLIRYGGEEFVAVLLETSPEQAVEIAENLRQAVAALDIPHHHSSAAPRVTISVGVATVNSRSARFDQLLREADEALYQAKATGRNRVVTASPLARPILTGDGEGCGHGERQGKTDR